MTPILIFLAQCCPLLFFNYGFRIIDSSAFSERPDAGSILLDSKDAAFFFSCERDQIWLEIRSKYDSRKNNWYSFDLWRGLLTGVLPETAQMNEDNARFLQERLPELIELLKRPRVTTTLKKLDALREARTKRRL